VDTNRVPQPHRHDDAIEAHYSSLERGIPHFCYDGWVFIGHVVLTPDGDEKVEHVPVRCRRCAAGGAR